MRRLFALIAGLGLLGSVGCHHNTCDDCTQDICSGCGHSRMYIVPAQPAKPAENIEKMPMPKP